MGYKSFEEINEKIRSKKAVVVTAEEIIGIVDEKGGRWGLPRRGCGDLRHVQPYVLLRRFSQLRPL